MLFAARCRAANHPTTKDRTAISAIGGAGVRQPGDVMPEVNQPVFPLARGVCLASATGLGAFVDGADADPSTLIFTEVEAGIADRTGGCVGVWKPLSDAPGLRIWLSGA